MKKLLAAAVLVMAAGSTHAGLIGATVGCSYADGFGNITCVPTSFVVGPGIEGKLAFGGGASEVFSFNFGGNTLQLTRTNGGGTVFGAAPPSTATFSGLGANGAITGLSNIVISGVPGLTPGAFSFTADTIIIDLTGVSWFRGDTASLTINFGVPEPATGLLMGSALFGSLLLRRRLRRAA